VGTSTGADQDEVLQQIAGLVFPHAYAEETVVWPVARAVLRTASGSPSRSSRSTR
jgi:hypothetical protein